jgi:potassium/chloride transporter 9
VLMGVIGSAKLLQALARDHLIPGLSIFSQGTKKADEPIYAVYITYIIAQVTMFADINQIASFITMTVRRLHSSYLIIVFVMAG